VGEDIAAEIVGVVEKVAAASRLNAIQKFRKLDRMFMEIIEGYSPDLVDYFHERVDREWQDNLTREFLKQRVPLYARIIRQGVDGGLFYCANPGETAAIMIWSWQGVEAELRSRDPKVANRAFKAAIDFIYKGLGYEPAQPAKARKPAKA